MTKNFAYLFFNIILFIDKTLIFFTKRSILIYFSEFLQNISYKKIIILNKNLKFYVPNSLVKWRVDTILSKEPETIEWIDGFNKKNKSIFWDVGANIGLYSIYNSLKNKKSTTIAFEPSTSNLRILSRNISINNLQNKIKIFTLPLTTNSNGFMNMKESLFQEGGSMNTFGENFNHEGKKFKPKMQYDLYGMNIKYLLDNQILDIPDYIKIDVDGIEHLILAGAGKYLKNKKLKSLSIEINENFTNHFERILKIMRENNFKIRHKKHNVNLFKDSGKKFINTYNYIFDKNN
jgi:FkbM family methyltransferase